MAKTKSTKRALLMSGLALFACISMLVGSTFAWFTDSVTSGKNIIAAGNLDVELYYSYDGAKWEPVKANTNVFKEGALWEPGYTEYVYLKVVNEGSLALEYNLNVNVASETGSVNVYGRDFLLSEHIKYGVVDYTNPFAGRDAAIDAVKSVAKNLENGYSHDTKALEPKGEDVYAMVVYMPTTVDNEANHAKGEVQPKIQLGINLFATQFTHEEDSFGKDYDDAARYTIAAGEETTMSDVTITAGMDNAGSVTVNGGTIDNEGAGLFNTGDAELKDVTINAGSPSDYAVIGQGSNSVTVLDGATLNSNGGGIGVADGAQMTVKGGTVHVDTTSTSGRYNIYAVGENTVVNVEGGEYSWDSSKNQKRAYIYAAAGAVVNVKGGTFGKASTRNGYTDGILTGANGTVVITGGTFGFDPTKWLAPGYQATKIGDNWIVAPSGVTPVTTIDALKQALADGKTDIVFAADIAGDATVAQAPGVQVTIDGAGYKFNGVLTVDGKSGTYTTAGLTIKNVNFKADSISADACIQLGNGTNSTRYTCNVTVADCTFDVPGAVGVKSYTGGDKNLTITGCTATANAHSLVQAKGIDVILVKDCKVYSKNGLNFNNSNNVSVIGCTVDVKGYAVRFGESSGGVGAAETYRIEDCTLKSACDDGDAVIILRGTADYATLTIVNTTIEGAIEINNTATGATVVK